MKFLSIFLLIFLTFQDILSSPNDEEPVYEFRQFVIQYENIVIEVAKKPGHSYLDIYILAFDENLELLKISFLNYFHGTNDDFLYDIFPIQRTKQILFILSKSRLI